MRNYFSLLQRQLTVCEHPRSGRWPEVRRNHLAIEGWCRVCGSTKDLQVHHIKPFHLYPYLELQPGNLITLCETIGVECHLRHGHLGNWHDFNPRILKEANSPRPGIPAANWPPAMTSSQLSTLNPQLSVGLVKGADFESTLIERFTRSPFSHALIICPDGSVWESLLDGGVQHNPSIETKHPGVPYDVLQMPLTRDQVSAILAFCESQNGKPYDWKDDIYFVTGGTEPATDTSTWFCSELVFAAFAAAGINLLDRIQPWQVSPAMLAYSPLLQQAA